MFKKLFVSSTSACFEFVNKESYYSPKNYTVLLNGEPVGSNRSSNVFSVFNLAPSTRYVITTTADKCKIYFTTDDESAVIDVKELGASGDGVTDDTFYLQMAVSSCPKGGRVLVPEGVYLTRPLVLRSDITLEIMRGATILGHADEKNYPFVPAKGVRAGKEEVLASWEGEPSDCHQSLITAYRSGNIKIIGEGTLNGNANNSTWWPTKERKLARPRLVFLNRCKNVVMHGITCKNSASWNLHSFFCKNLQFLDLKVRNPATAPNTDGLVTESSENVEIIGCNVFVGDDCYAIKSDFNTGEINAENNILRNCLSENGREESGDAPNLTVSQCIFKHI